MKLRVLRKYLGPHHGVLDKLQWLVNVNECDYPGCLVMHEPKWEWQDVPVVDEKDSA